MQFRPETASKILDLLRNHGWEQGLIRLKAEIEATDDLSFRNDLRLFAGWIAAERGKYTEAARLFDESCEIPEALGWCKLGHAFIAMRRRQHDLVENLLNEIQEPEDSVILRAGIAHLRGSNYFYAGKLDQALPLFNHALEMVGHSHFASGRVLDSLGVLYSRRDHYHVAEMFFLQAIASKKALNDLPGLIVLRGNLGRHYLEWGHLDQAEEQFLENLELARSIRDERAESIVKNSLGRVCMKRAHLAALASRPDEARSQREDALGWLDSSLKGTIAGGWAALEAYVRKDLALLHLSQDRLDVAEAEVTKAIALFAAASFPDGLPHARRVEGMVYRRQGRFDEAKQALRASLELFEAVYERAERAQTQWEVARVARDAGEPRPLVTREYLTALKLAEESRRDALVRGIGDELKVINPEAYHHRIFHRVRGRGMPEETDSLVTGTDEPLTVLFLDLKGSTAYALNAPPAVVMMTLNQMMTEMVETLREHDALISSFRGDGFLAIFRGNHHAKRAVSAGIDLCRRVEEFNIPRVTLGLPPFAARIGISTGAAVLGNVGTYDLLAFTAIGTTVNLGARLESEGIPGFPCISQKTYEDVLGQFVYREDSPRRVIPKGLEELGPLLVWDVVGKSS